MRMMFAYCFFAGFNYRNYSFPHQLDASIVQFVDDGWCNDGALGHDEFSHAVQPVL
jgi:hypothetical protein